MVVAVDKWSLFGGSLLLKFDCISKQKINFPFFAAMLEAILQKKQSLKKPSFVFNYMTRIPPLIKIIKDMRFNLSCSQAQRQITN